jgi:hypothetical protein
MRVRSSHTQPVPVLTNYRVVFNDSPNRANWVSDPVGQADCSEVMEVSRNADGNCTHAFPQLAYRSNHSSSGDNSAEALSINGSPAVSDRPCTHNVGAPLLQTTDADSGRLV